MNRNRKGVMPTITREIYKNVKKFDRQQFERFCTEIYKCGFEDGKESAESKSMDLDNIYKAILGTKGIGEKKMAEIKANIEKMIGVNEDDKARS